MKRKKQKNSRRFNVYVIVVGIVVLLAVAGGLTYHFAFQKSSNNTSVNNPANPASNQSNQSVSNSAKQHDLQQQKQSPPPSGSSTSSGNLTNVGVVITSAAVSNGNVVVRGYASTFENGGTCTATFSSGTTSFDKTSSAIENAQNVVCPTVTVPVSQFNPKGQWQVVLKYTSSDATGVSNAQTFEVQ